ncbi:MAG: DUF2510 domain-containing protein [Acidimicrobiales bacterium]|jgi:hypothetical protein
MNTDAWPVVGIVLLFALYFIVIIGSIALLIIALIDIVKRPEWQWKIAGQEKVLWLLLVVLVNFLAIPSLIYWFNIRKKLIAVEKAAASGQLGLGHMTYGGWEPTPSMPMAFVDMPPPNWQPDPSGQYRWRWWNGHQWTDHVSDGDTGPFPTVGNDSPRHS